MASPTLEALFDEYAGIRDDEAREAFAFANPRLLSLASVQALAERRGRSAAVAELAGLQTQLARHPESYQIGVGPIEDLLTRETDPNRMIEVCRSADFQARISPLYLRVLAQGAATLARGDDWQTGSYLSLLGAQAALGWEPTAPTHPLVVETLTLHVQAAVFALSAQLDDGIFEWALAPATELLARVEARDERDAIGLLCHAIGMLFSDIWTVPGRPDDGSPVDARAWIARRIAAPGSSAPPAIRRPCRRQPSRSMSPSPGTSARFHSAPACGAASRTRRSRRRSTSRSASSTSPSTRPSSLGAWRSRRSCSEKHPDTSHLEALASIAAANGTQLGGPGAPLPAADQQLLDEIRADAAPEDAASPDAGRRRESHAAALHDLERALRHGLPWALCLRNFDYANEYFRLGDDVVEEREGAVRIMVPRIRYSLVDHKVLQLFPEGAVAISDPRSRSRTSDSTLIPMFSLGARWADVAESLMARSTRVVIVCSTRCHREFARSSTFSQS